MSKWWNRLIGKVPPKTEPALPVQSEPAIKELERGADMRERRERVLVNELRRLERQLSKDGR